MAAGALFFLVLVLLGYYYYTYIMPKSCKVDTDCTAPKTCLSGSCAAPGGGGATGTAQPEVYYLGVGANGGYTFANSTAGMAVADQLNLNATNATLAQVTAAQAASADWCNAGWDSEGNGVYPITIPRAGCASAAGVATYASGGPFGVNLYGVKPSATSSAVAHCSKLSTGDTATPCILPFNATKWSQYSS